MRIIKTYPSLAEYINNCIKADYEDENSRDTVSMNQYLLYFILNNLRLRGHINTRRTAIQSWGYDLVSFNKRDLQDDYNNLKNVIRTVLSSYINTTLFGVNLISINWEFIDNKKQVPKVNKIYKSYEIENYDFQRVAILENRKRIVIDNEDINYIAMLDNEQFRGGLMRSIGITEIMRNTMINEWGNYNRKQKGIIQGIDRGGDDSERKVLEQGLNQLNKENYIVTSDLIDVVFHQISASNAGNSFKDFVEHCINSIAISILGQANTSELPKGGGSRAALQVQQMISADLMYSDIIGIEAIINDFIAKYYKINYGDKEVDFEFKVKLDEIEDKEANMQVISQALDAGIELSKVEVYNKIGMSIPESNEEIIKREL